MVTPRSHNNQQPSVSWDVYIVFDISVISVAMVFSYHNDHKHALAAIDLLKTSNRPMAEYAYPITMDYDYLFFCIVVISIYLIIIDLINPRTFNLSKPILTCREGVVGG